MPPTAVRIPLPAQRPLPASLRQALGRGATNRCPRCAARPLFRRWLKPIDRCPTCVLDLTRHRADDFPAYIAIVITGHVTAPVLLPLALATSLPMAATIAISFAIAATVMALTLQPAKGAVIAFQWWQGMHGFIRERPDPAARPGP